MNTILIDTVTHDLVIDSNGNIALASNPYAIAQDVGSACRLWLGELWYDQTEGVPYFESILGKNPSGAMVSAFMEAAALTVPDVVEAQCTSLSLVNRELSGTIQIIDVDGYAQGVRF